MGNRRGVEAASTLLAILLDTTVIRRAVGISGDRWLCAFRGEIPVTRRIAGSRLTSPQPRSGRAHCSSVDGAEVLAYALGTPLSGDQVGLYGYGKKPVTIKGVRIDAVEREAFVVMPFSEPYNSLWK